jgi:hypothetical protein
MSEQEVQELIQKYRDRYRTNGQYNIENAWEFIANSLALDLLQSKREIRYLKEKIIDRKKLQEQKI